MRKTSFIFAIFSFVIVSLLSNFSYFLVDKIHNLSDFLHVFTTLGTIVSIYPLYLVFIKRKNVEPHQIVNIYMFNLGYLVGLVVFRDYGFLNVLLLTLGILFFPFILIRIIIFHINNK